jgi:hypothetical protein
LAHYGAFIQDWLSPSTKFVLIGPQEEAFMLRQNSGQRADAPPAQKSQLPVIIGSFMTGVAAMTLVGVVAPALATASAPDVRATQEARTQTFQHSPVALTEISEEQRRGIEARLAAAELALAEARADTDRAVARLDGLSGN